MPFSDLSILSLRFSRVKCLKTFSFLLAVSLVNYEGLCQSGDLSQFPKKGSYLYYGQPAFEDNSFLLEEAFNQPMGVLQNISNFSFNNVGSKNFAYSFTQEIPLTNETHQLSYTLSYNIQKPDNRNIKTNGFGDVYISYRPQIFGKNDWIMLIPRITLILPTGKAFDGMGDGGWGGQLNLAATKRLSRKIVTHYNAGVTFISNADKYGQSVLTDERILTYEKNLYHKNAGASAIWYPVRKFNLFLEYVYNLTGEIKDDGRLTSHQLHIVNPGFRFCIDNGRMQIVPGLSMPVNFENGRYDHKGLLVYLSIEPDYLSFSKAKDR